jgi:hypothetical protein
MTNETALAVQDLTVREIGTMCVKSGFFKDAEQEAQAIVKILAGREAGLQPIESMTGIHIIKGKITFGANMMASAVKKHPNYDYRVSVHTDKECSIDFFEITNGKREKIGTSSFSVDEAKQIGLTANMTWKNYPKAMLFARALSAGVRYYCPDVFGHAPVYVPEELGANVDGDGEVIDITPKPSPIVERALKIIEEDREAEQAPIIEAPVEKPKRAKKPKEDTPELKVIPSNPLPCAGKTYLFGPEMIKDTPYATLEAISDKASNHGMGKDVRPIIESVVPTFYKSDLEMVDLPEKTMIQIIELLTGINMEAT